MHSFPAASVATTAVRAATLRPEAAVGGTSRSAETESKPEPRSLLPSLPRSLARSFFPRPRSLARSLPARIAFPPPAAGDCDVPPPPPPLTDGRTDRSGGAARARTDLAARGRAS